MKNWWYSEVLVSNGFKFRKLFPRRLVPWSVPLPEELGQECSFIHQALHWLSLCALVAGCQVIVCSTPSCVPFFPTSINSIIIVLWFNFALKFPDVSGEWSGWGMMQRRLTWELVAMLWCKHWTYWDHEFGSPIVKMLDWLGLEALAISPVLVHDGCRNCCLKCGGLYCGIWKALRFLPSRARWDWCEKGLEDAVLERPLGPQ